MPPRRGARLPLHHAVALGAIHGPAELLPVSSSAHVGLVPALLGWPYAELPGDVRKAFEVAHRPAQAANVDQAIMILKMLRPKTDIRSGQPRAKQRITSLTLPRIEPTT